MSNPMLLSFAELQNASDLWCGAVSDQLRGAVNSLLSAVTDWPTFGLQEPIDLLVSLHTEISEPLTFNALQSYAAVVNDPWKREAVNALLELFAVAQKPYSSSSTELEDILMQLTQQYRTAILPPKQ